MTTEQLEKILKKFDIHCDIDGAYIENEINGVYIYAYIDVDMGWKETTVMVNDEDVELSEEQKELILSKLQKEYDIYREEKELEEKDDYYENNQY